MIEIKRCKDDNQIEEIAVLAKVIWNEYFQGIITQEQIDYMVEMNQSYHAIHKAVREANYTYFMVYEDETLVGYMGVQPQDKRLFLSKFYIHKDARGKGYGTCLMNQAKSFCQEQHLNSIYLTCNKYNDNSLNLYKHYGFEVIDSVETDIGNGFIMDDYIFELTL